ncbi:prephenate dehydrogenase [Treponema endosymbiont of Eucomonympha sp.]|uniref:prephenate dehydrogenase n=1 Tax=Treponema endosymbiont of Eucomonympha sp. TaxID=1580831 RepID=UPI000A8619F7|nr:prephenate dehydrogenase [Treponema endosymbiont of Eucomonympha sp.]
MNTTEQTGGHGEQATGAAQGFGGIAAHLVYGIVGLGLMGGSLAKALRAFVLNATAPADSSDLPGQARGKILALDVNKASLEQAAHSGVIDEGFLADGSPHSGKARDTLTRCDVVFVCLYPRATIGFLKWHRADFKTGALVTDISGVKAALATELPALIRGDVDFIAGHPMAGSEKEGYAYASEAIFAGRNYILMPQPQNTQAHLVFFKRLVRAIGFTRVIETDYATHDRKIAFTSQLCHIIASALVDSAEDTRVTAFGGGSFEDLTRIAMINAPLWTELFLANREALSAHIESFERSLADMKRLIVEGDSARLTEKLENVRAKRSAMQS